jgi:hypothetical protein
MLDIKFKCDLCGLNKESEEIARAYNFMLHKGKIEKAGGFTTGTIHICKDCMKVVQKYPEE